jgi:hypothetical protein
MFTVEMLPASHGDCLWLEYGDPGAPHRVLIDGGPAYVYDGLEARLQARLGSLPPEERRFELVVITHIDSDHIGRLLEVIIEHPLGITVGDVWFYDWDHLPGAAPDALGAVQGEQLSAVLDLRGMPQNVAFGGDAVAVPERGDLPVVSLPGGLTLTLLSPTPKELAKLRPKWKSTVEEAGLVAGSAEDALAKLRRQRHGKLPPDLLGERTPDPHALAQEPFRPDTSVANGSSIALLAEVDGKRCLLAGDALAGVVAGSVERLANGGRLEIDALKLSHHGGKKNTSAALLDQLRCRRFLFSTDGSRFGHPDQASVARAILAGGEGTSLCFNYRTEVNDVWDDRGLKREFGYETLYPADDQEGLVVSL